jgi:hypothetical protein
MKIFRKKVSGKQDEKTLAEARELAALRLEQYFADRRTSPPEKSLKKSVNPITRLRWW